MPETDHRATCPWCGGPDLTGLYVIDEYHIDSCAACGIAFVNPQPDDERLAAHYYAGDEYTDPASPQVRRHLRWKQYDFAKILPDIEDLRGGRHLDVGCGIGGLLAASQHAGFAAVGIEFSPKAAAFGRRCHGVSILTGTLADHPFPAASFSLVTLYHCLEHLRDPARDLAQVCRLVRPGGALVIECPDATSTSARHFGPTWFHLDVPRHLFHFSPAIVEKRLEQEGFAVVARGGYHPAHGRAAFYGSLFRAKAGLPFLEKVRRRASVAAVRLLSWPLAIAEARWGQGSIFRLMARNA